MKSRTAFITTSWDDGHPKDLRLAELLDKYGIPGTFYIPLRNDRAVLASNQIQEISASFEIGGHTLSHCDLTKVTDKEAEEEIANCKGIIEDITSRRCLSFCFPLGHFRRRHVRMALRAGYEIARTVELLSIAAPRMCCGLPLVPTSIQARAAEGSTYVRNALKRGRIGNLIRYINAPKADWAITAEALLNEVVSRGGVFHLWGHSWEIEEERQWDSLERVLAKMAGVKGMAQFVTNSALASVSHG